MYEIEKTICNCFYEKKSRKQKTQTEYCALTKGNMP